MKTGPDLNFYKKTSFNDVTILVFAYILLGKVVNLRQKLKIYGTKSDCNLSDGGRTDAD